MNTSNNYNGFKGLIESRIQEKQMTEPSAEKFEKFISENKLQKKEIEKEAFGFKYIVIAYYINEELCKVEVSQNGKEMFNGSSSHPQFNGFISQLSKQLSIEL
jgi:hypothetical protein